MSGRRVGAGRMAIVYVGLAVIGWLALPAVGRAGDGKIEKVGNGYQLHLTVYFEYAVTPDDLEKWKACFRDTSSALWVATGGNLYLGKITLTTDSSVLQRADIQIAKAGATFLRAHATGLHSFGKEDGGHVQLDSSYVNSPMTLLHELGHYVFGVADEYKGTVDREVPGATSSTWEEVKKANGSPWWDWGEYMTANQLTEAQIPWYCASQRTANSADACVMDGGELTNPSDPAHSGLRTRTRFCLRGTATFPHIGERISGGLRFRSDRWYDSGHEYTVDFGTGVHSCWDDVAKKLGISVPSSYPVVTSPRPADPTFVIATFNAFMVCLDRSGSSRAQDTDCSGAISASEDAGSGINLAIRGGVTCILKSKAHKTPATGPEIAGDLLGVVSFNHTVSLDSPLLEMTGTTKAAALANLGALVTGGGTDIALGLLQAITEIKDAQATLGPDSEYASRSIILISDGSGTAGDPAATASLVLPALRESKIKVYAIAFPDTADAAYLRTITAVGGFIRWVRPGENLAAVVGEIFARARGELTSLSPSGTANPGSSTPVSMTVDSFSNEATFTLAGSSSTSPLVLRLADPTGAVINLASPPEGVTVDTSNGITAVRISAPTAGDWTATVDATTATAAEDYALDLTPQATTLTLTGGINRSDYAYPEPVRISIGAAADGLVAGCTATCLVTRPDGTTTSIQLFDDGNRPAHGDLFPGDGIYGNLYSDYVGEGAYTFEATATNVNGTLTNPEGGSAPWAGNPPRATPVAPFTRTATYSTTVSGVPTGGGTAVLPPGTPSITSADASSASLAWTDTNAGTASHVVQRRTASTTFADVATLSAGTNSYTDSGLAAGDYDWQVLAEKAGGRSEPSNVASATLGSAAGGGSSGDGSSGDAGGGGCALRRSSRSAHAIFVVLALAVLGFLSPRRAGKAVLGIAVPLLLALGAPSAQAQLANGPYDRDARYWLSSSSGGPLPITITFKCNYQTASEGLDADKRFVYLTSSSSMAYAAQLGTTSANTTVGSPMNTCAAMGTWHTHSFNSSSSYSPNSQFYLYFRFKITDTTNYPPTTFKGWFIDDLQIKWADGSIFYQQNFDGTIDLPTTSDPTNGWQIMNSEWAFDGTPSAMTGGPVASGTKSLNFNDGPAPTPPPPASFISRVSPNEIAVGATVTMTLTGKDFTSGSSTVTAVLLQRSGQTDIAGSSITVASATSLTVTFAIPGGAATGAWNLVVQRSDGTTRTRAQAVEIYTP